MALTAGTYINAFPVRIEERQPVTRIPAPPPASRRDLERRFGVPLFVYQGAAWTAAEIEGQQRLEIGRDEHFLVHLFNLREALRLKAADIGWDFWFQKGEMNAVRPGVRERIEPFVTQSVLKTRAVWEGVQAEEVLLVASSSVRWLVERSLTDAGVQSVAIGEHALRREGVTVNPPGGRIVRFDGDRVFLHNRDGGDDLLVEAKDYQLVARPALVFRLLEQTHSHADASAIYTQLLAASGSLRREDRRAPNRYAAKERFNETESLLNDFGREFELQNGTVATIASMPREVFVLHGPATEPWSASIMKTPQLRFDAAIPSRSDSRAYQGLRLYGSYSLKGLQPSPHILLAYPSAVHQEAERFGEKLLSGSGNYPGFAKLFGLPESQAPSIEHLRLPAGDNPRDIQRLKLRLDEWAGRTRDREPDLAIVMVPHTDRWDTDTPYYAAKEFFGARGTPSQMVTLELLRDTGRLGWSLANIALAGFAKLGGVPWVVDARGHDADLVIGVGRADVRASDGERRRTFGYAVAFVANGAYLSTHSFPPASSDGDYEQQLTRAITAALLESRHSDSSASRIVIHLSKRTGSREVTAAQTALKEARMADLPVAFVRIDDSSLFEFLDGAEPTFAPPKGLTLRLSERRALVQVETATNFGPARRPLLVELDKRSTVTPKDLGSLVLQIFRLGHANWRGFNARSKPVTLLYGERLAELVGYMNERGQWDPASMRSELRGRPWFL